MQLLFKNLFLVLILSLHFVQSLSKKDLNSQIRRLKRQTGKVHLCGLRELSITYSNDGNSWTGQLDLARFNYLNTIYLNLKVDQQAKIYVDEKEGKVEGPTIGASFWVTYYGNAKNISDVKFTIEKRLEQELPSLVELRLNNRNICTGTGSVITESTTTTSSPVVSYIDYQDEEEICGKRKVSFTGYVTNGEPTYKGEFPWHAAISHKLGAGNAPYRCGGTLINRKIVITAAHCVFLNSLPLSEESVKVTLAVHNLEIVTGAFDHEVHKIIVHDYYDIETLANDIAIIKLKQKATYTKYVQPICLWPASQSSLTYVENRYGTVPGWGITSVTTGKLGTILNKASLQVISTAKCLEQNTDQGPNFYGVHLTTKNFCAGNQNATNVCNGDSGGGLVFEQNGSWFLRGIVSLGPVSKDNNAAKCSPFNYVVFTDVPQYLGWIEKHAR